MGCNDVQSADNLLYRYSATTATTTTVATTTVATTTVVTATAIPLLLLLVPVVVLQDYDAVVRDEHGSMHFGTTSRSTTVVAASQTCNQKPML